MYSKQNHSCLDPACCVPVSDKGFFFITTKQIFLVWLVQYHSNPRSVCLPIRIWLLLTGVVFFLPLTACCHCFLHSDLPTTAPHMRGWMTKSDPRLSSVTYTSVHRTRGRWDFASIRLFVSSDRCFYLNTFVLIPSLKRNDVGRTDSLLLWASLLTALKLRNHPPF